VRGDATTVVDAVHVPWPVRLAYAVAFLWGSIALVVASFKHPAVIPVAIAAIGFFGYQFRTGSYRTTLYDDDQLELKQPPGTTRRMAVTDVHTIDLGRANNVNYLVVKFDGGSAKVWASGGKQERLARILRDRNPTADCPGNRW
jgi:hypothetical protein